MKGQIQQKGGTYVVACGGYGCRARKSCTAGQDALEHALDRAGWMLFGLALPTWECAACAAKRRSPGRDAQRSDRRRSLAEPRHAT